jgi:hypothetical protein
MAAFLKNQSTGSESAAARGRLMAQLLAGSWRSSPPPVVTADEAWAEVALLLLKCGVGALSWWRLRSSELRDESFAEQFHREYRFQALNAALNQRALKLIIRQLRDNDVEPVLVKGWSVARHYPETGLRQYGDFDLCILPDQFDAASAQLESFESQGYKVDLHCGFGKFFESRTDEIFERSQLVKLDDVAVRILSQEDLLRFLCLHWLRHGAVRPLWLCDIAVLLEAQGEDFDWDRCLGSSQQQADWVACAVGLARELLGARIKPMPIAQRSRALPKWLVPAVLKEWGAAFRPMTPLTVHLRHPFRFKNLLEELTHHWPNPIEATMTLNAPFNELPRLPFQVGHVFSRTAALVAQLAGGAATHPRS